MDAKREPGERQYECNRCGFVGPHRAMRPHYNTCQVRAAQKGACNGGGR